MSLMSSGGERMSPSCFICSDGEGREGQARLPSTIHTMSYLEVAAGPGRLMVMKQDRKVGK